MRLTRLLDPDRYFPGLWDLRSDARALAHWVEMFRLQTSDMLRLMERCRGRAATTSAERARTQLMAVLDHLDEATLERYPSVQTWTELREGLLERLGIEDPYQELKAQENELMLPQLQELCAGLRDAPGAAMNSQTPDRARTLRLALAGIFAGNRFDVGSPIAAREWRSASAGFAAARAAAADLNWFHDSSAALLALLNRQERGCKIVIAVDNAGADFIGGVLPLSWWLAESGFSVVLAANERPALNDVTAAEASVLLRRAAAFEPGFSRLQVVSTGTGTPGIDLRAVSPEFDREVQDAVLLVLEGQGRALESNWSARLDLPVLRIATIKDALVAERLGAQVYDPVLTLHLAGEQPAMLGTWP